MHKKEIEARTNITYKKNTTTEIPVPRALAALAITSVKKPIFTY